MIWTNRDAKICTAIILGVVAIAALFALVVGGCTTTPEPTGEPTPTPTMETSPVSPLATPTPVLPEDFVPVPVVTIGPKESDNARPLFQAASHALVDLGRLLPVESTTHFHQLRLVRQLRRVDTGEVLFEASIVTGIIGTDYIPEPETRFAAAWTYNIDLEAEFGVKEAAEYIKPIWVCIREPDDIEPCLCQMKPGEDLVDCTEIVGQCESKGGLPQDDDGFCFTDFFTELPAPELHRQWLPIVFVERE